MSLGIARTAGLLKQKGISLDRGMGVVGSVLLASHSAAVPGSLYEIPIGIMIALSSHRALVANEDEVIATILQPGAHNFQSSCDF